MATTLTVEEAQARLKELIASLPRGEQIILTDHHQPVARIISERSATSPRPAPGLGKGSILYMAPDFDDPLEDFREYME